MRDTQLLCDGLLLLSGAGATFGLWYGMFGWWGIPAALVVASVSGAVTYVVLRRPRPWRVVEERRQHAVHDKEPLPT